MAHSNRQFHSDALQKLDVVENETRELVENFCDVYTCKNVSLLENYIKGKFSLVLDANISREGNDPRWRSDSSACKSANNFTVFVFAKKMSLIPAMG